MSTWPIDLSQTQLADIQEGRSASCSGQQSSFACAEATDEALLALAAANDRSALSVLFRRHATAVRAVGFRILRDEGEAEDLRQEVFLYVLHHAGVFAPSKSTAMSWIIQMAYHRAFDRRRYLMARRFYASEELEDRHPPGTGGRDHEQQIVQKIDGQEMLKRFREDLTPEQCCVLELFYFKGNSLREIIEETGMSYASVRGHFYRGLSRLRSLLLPQSKLNHQQ
ncbi:RNA polymerase sigma-70 factor, ECF subfamily [Bryocella elongata]|uniref:RNA polymerase sigma-70 factor, ECF subfamily n=1 Tax=Bryocella elongata TaxID=863522 RepID=A0A1H6BSH1_9BACT|nr:sigma-70 family RNA polymerase sigma factor [Bryocella elongata]SEG63582.1 RNA polymerase sigma-70 factor, ECF subfamily [Bryocella elongata]